jgi:retron-type reverse transcriptase
MGLVSQLASTLGKTEDEVTNFLFDAPRKYKVYKIPKRSHGFRIIAQPSKELKLYQRAFLHLYQLPVHDVAMAYRPGLSIKINALHHAKNPYLLKIDLENFFNSINPDLLWAVWDAALPPVSTEEKFWLNRLLFWSPSKKTIAKLILSIGAPSSPEISNFCMYHLDHALFAECQNKGITYTRYADDLTFSCNKKNILFEMPQFVEMLLQRFFNGRLRINARKTVFSSKAHNRHITGLTISNAGTISLGRDKKRLLKHLVHQFSLSKITPEELMYLRGMLAFANHVEPEFMISLKKKYSAEVMKSIWSNSYE